MRAYLSNSAATFNCGRKAFEEDKNKDFKKKKKNYGLLFRLKDKKPNF